MALKVKLDIFPHGARRGTQQHAADDKRDQGAEDGGGRWERMRFGHGEWVLLTTGLLCPKQSTVSRSGGYAPRTASALRLYALVRRLCTLFGKFRPTGGTKTCFRQVGRTTLDAEIPARRRGPG